MLGSIIGDIVGSRFEFNNCRDKDFSLFSVDCSFTDDTICTIAIADSLVKGISFEKSLREWCRRYPNPMGGYGASFDRWLHSKYSQPYNSFGNGSAMRVSPIGYACKTEYETFKTAIESACPTHNHPEGIIGAMSVADAIFNLRKGRSWESISDLYRQFYGREIGENIIAPGIFDETCQGTVPVAFMILQSADSFEDALRKAILYGGDSDTLGAIVGSMAETLFGIPEWISQKALTYLPEEMKNVIDEFKLNFDYGY